MRPAPILVLSSVWLLAGLTLSSPADAQCPADSGAVGIHWGCALKTSTAPTFSYGAWCVVGDGHVSYDLIRGTIHADAYSSEDMDAFIQANDDFVINGPLGGGSITITAVLNCTTLNCGWATLFSGAIRDSLPREHSRLEITLQHPVGEHFPIGMYAFACSAGYNSFITGTLGFTALPPGYSLRSCQGYSALPVATQSMSWGRLKTYYR